MEAERRREADRGTGTLKNSDMKDDTVGERQEADNTNHISVFLYYPAV